MEGKEAFKKAHSSTSKDPATQKETVKWDSKANEEKFLRAQYNQRFVENEGSLGVHNYKYARQLLMDSLSHLE